MKAAKLTVVFIAAVSAMVLGGLSINNAHAYASTQTSCTDVTQRSDLGVQWTGMTSVMVYTKSGLPVCSDTQLYYSTYALPMTYDGQGFYYANTNQTNPSAYPQSLLTNQMVTILAGQDSASDGDLPVIDTCVTTQADVYYGPQIVGINAQGYGYHADGSLVYGSADVDHTFPIPGHGTQLIDAQIYDKTIQNCGSMPGLGGGNGDTPVTTPATPVALTPVASTPQTTSLTIAPIILPDTGADANGTAASVMALILTVGSALLATGIRTARSSRL